MMHEQMRSKAGRRQAWRQAWLRVAARPAGMMIVALLALSLLPLAARAALQVTTFTCNSESGTITVENQGSLTCEAAIQNTGSSTETLNSVSLYTSGSWANAASFAGSGFSSSIAAGATTTASFTGITPTTSGVHQFSSILMDTTSDTTAASAQVNVISIKNLELSASSQKALGSAFTVTASITAGGNLGAVTANLSIPSSECVITGDLKSQQNDMGAINNNAVTSTSWTLVQGNDSCWFNVSVAGVSADVTVRDWRNATVSNSSEAQVQDAGANLTPFTTTLQPGWNALSIPLNLTNMTPSYAFASLGSNYSYVWAYNGSWQYFIPGSGGTLAALQPGYGYWLYVNDSNAQTLLVNGTNLSVTVPLATSYQLLGYNANATVGMASAFGSVSQRYYVWSYAAGSWYWYDSAGLSFLNTLNLMTPGRAYYVAADAADNWTVSW